MDVGLVCPQLRQIVLRSSLRLKRNLHASDDEDTNGRVR
jgi:hypothetical protein